MGARLTILIGAFALAYAVLGYRFYDLQVSQGDYYGAQASSINLISGELVPIRGSVYFQDKDGGQVPAAINKEHPIAYAVPEEVEDPVAAAQFLDPLVEDKGYEELLEKLSKEGDPYEPLIDRPTPEQADAITQASISGIYLGTGLDRFYPFGDKGSHVLGYTSTNESVWLGKYGVESYYNQLLGGVPGEAKGDKLKAPKHGQDLQLTIDANIQTQAESILENLITNYAGAGGTVIVADPNDGKILAMASFPNFNPNEYSKFDIGTFLNPAVESVYEPGSIFKVITMASALDAGAVVPTDTFNDPGELTLNAHTIRNWDLKAHGTVTMSNIIEKSLNTGAAYVQRQLGNDKFHDYLEKFGFKDKTEIDLPGEVTGSLLPIEQDVRDINFATASFGQGISTTPIRLLTAISAIANGGDLMRPYINTANRPQKVRRVISEKASDQIVDMMVSAVDKAVVARIEGYSVAGKTGTAQVPKLGGGGYTEEVINTYVGFAPAYDPDFIILVRLDKPYGAPLAGLTVVPAFRDLAEFVINYYNIPPDRIDIE